jgi:integrase
MEMAAAVHLTLIAPDNEKFMVRSAPARLPKRKPNAEYRSREHLTEREVERLIEAVKGNRWGHRDATMVLMAFRHGLSASELVDLRWEQIDPEHALLHVRRFKNGSPATHPLTGKELRALRRLEREQELNSPFVFTSERGTPFTKRGFQAMVERAGEAA